MSKEIPSGTVKAAPLDGILYVHCVIWWSAEKPVYRISISELCKEADVNRSTFYSHYSDPGDVLKEIEDDLIAKIPISISNAVKIRSDTEFMKALSDFLNYIKEHEKTVRIILGSENGNQLRGRMIDVLYQKYGIADREDLTPLSRYRLRYIFNGFFGMLDYWIEQGFPISCQDLAILAVDAGLKAGEDAMGLEIWGKSDIR